MSKRELTQHLVDQGSHREVAAGFDVSCRLHNDTLTLSTAVFSGGDYIPGSVRKALQSVGLTAHSGRTHVGLRIDEAKFQVVLRYETEWNPVELDNIFDDFLGLADEWRWLLDEYGQQDLVYVTV